MKPLCHFLLLLWLCQFGLFSSAQTQSVEPAQIASVKNVMMFIGDGMGNQQRRLAAIIQGKGNADHRLVMESFSTCGIAFCHSRNAIVPDSAAAGTALATGNKTNNRMIGFTPAGKKLPTILEACKQKGMSAGLITTVMIDHATPACFGAHVKNRRNFKLIAPQYLANQIEVLLGGGRNAFRPALLEKFRRAGYYFANDRKALMQMDPDKSKRILGLFAYKAMDYEIDRNPNLQPSLAEMTRVALRILGQNPKGFFLMVEGGKIDWANHGNDAIGSIYDTLALDAAVQVGMEFLRTHPQTLIIVVNDHETGGMAIGERINVAAIGAVKASVERLEQLIRKNQDKIDEICRQYAGITQLAPEEKHLIIEEAQGRFRFKDQWGYGRSVIANILNRRIGVQFATGSHSGTPAIVAAHGSGSQSFDGFYHQTEVARKIARLLQIELK